jgi:hypothetical protein
MATVAFEGEIVFTHPKFIAVQEDDGRKQTRWQVWNATGDKGQRVHVTGELKTTVAKPREEGGEVKYVDHAVNNSKVTPAAATTSSAPAEDPWGTDPNAFDESTPF